MIEYLVDLSSRMLKGLLLILGMLTLCIGFAIVLGKIGKFISHICGIII